jgi:predicted ABC-type ATPase
MPAPRCVVIAGPNGAGKSTVAPDLVRDLHRIGRYVNADVIASGLAGFSPEIADRRAGRITLQIIDSYIDARADFAFETTLSGRRWPRLLHTLESARYFTSLIYLWLPSDELAVSRVRHRVERGGHDVPDGDVRRRYASSLRNLREIWLPRVDAWQILDASRLESPILVASRERGSGVRVLDESTWARIQTELPRVREPSESYDHCDSIDNAKRPSDEQVLTAARRGVRRALAIHKALGVATTAWRDGRVVVVSPDELPALSEDENAPVPDVRDVR